MRRSLLVPFLAVAALLAACVGNVRQNEVATYDLGPSAIAWRPATLALRDIEVAAPSWLGGTAMHYRLLYGDGQRRMTFTESRWAAPPAQLIERALKRQPASGEGGCRLRVEIDELAQVFDSPQASRVVLEARAALLPPRGDIAVARKALALMEPAGIDAKSGAAAAAAAVRALGGALGTWLAAVPNAEAQCK